MSGNAGLERQERLLRLVADLGATFHLRAAYAPTHPQVTGAIDKMLAALSAWCAAGGTGEASILLVEGHLLVDREPVPEDAQWSRGLLRALRRYDISGMTLVLGLDRDEFNGFLGDCLGAAGAVSTPHVVIGRGGFAVGEEPEAGGGHGDEKGSPPAPSPAVEAAGARSEFLSAATGGTSRIDRLRNLVARLARGAGASELDPEELRARKVEDGEFLHGLAVATTAARLGRALRLERKALEELTLAALLHDVGFLVGAGEDPVHRRSLHPVRGAARLAELEGVPDVAVLVAYEHHLRFDQLASYPVTRARRPPGAAARVVAVADTWATLRLEQALPVRDALAALHARAGTFLDPALVQLMVRTQPRE